MKIERVTRYLVADKEFETLEKAQDHVDGLVNKALHDNFCHDGQSGLTLSQVVNVTTFLLANREYFAMLLSAKFEEDDE